MPPSAGRLVELGLTSYEAKAYLALVRRDSFAAADVARLAGIPRQRIYDVLATLVQKGLASQRPGHADEVRRRRARVRDRAPAARPGARSSTGSSARAASMIDALEPAFAEGQKERDPLDYIEVLRDRRGDQRAVRRAAGGNPATRSSSSRSRRTPRRPQENVEGLEVTRTHRARERLRVLRARRSRLRRTASAASSRPARRRASSRSCR